MSFAAVTFFSVNRGKSLFLTLTLSSVTMKFTANTITGLDWAAKVQSHGSYVHFEAGAAVPTPALAAAASALRSHYITNEIILSRCFVYNKTGARLL